MAKNGSGDVTGFDFDAADAAPPAMLRGAAGAPDGAVPRGAADAVEPLSPIVGQLHADGHITDAQIRHARRVQAKLGTPRPLLKVLQELEMVGADQIRRSIREHRLSIKLGALLVELGHIGEGELRAALNTQASSPERKRLGEILIEQHVISEQKLTELLADSLGFTYVEPKIADIDKRLLARIALRYCLDNAFIPVAMDGDAVVVAFADPTDKSHRDAAQQMFGSPIVPAIAKKTVILEALRAHERGARQRSDLDEQSAISIVEGLVLEAINARASDIHIEPQRTHTRVRFRIDGAMIDYTEISAELTPSVTSRLKILAAADIAERRRHQGGRILFEDPVSCDTLDLRASFYVTIHGEKIVLRLLSRRAELLDINTIGMAPRMLERFRHDALEVPTGVVLITGPTGSGKTTTLYSCVDSLNKPDTSIITVEDPVEYVIEGVAQCSINPKINLTFEETLRHIVRQDPDVIVLGEIRDQFSAETAVQAALTGHKVLTTFHTEDSIGGLLRLLNMNIEAFLISSTVVSVLAQRLLRKVCDHCGEPHTPTSEELRRLGVTAADVRGAKFRTGRGCAHCRFTGYTGRLCVFELLVLNEMVKDAILNRRTSYEIRRISIESSGLVTLLEDGLHKAASGITTLQEVLRNLPRVSKPRPLQEIRRLLGTV